MHASFSDKFLSQRREFVTSQQDKRHNRCYTRQKQITQLQRIGQGQGLTVTFARILGSFALLDLYHTTCVSSHEESGATLQHARARVVSRTQIAQLGVVRKINMHEKEKCAAKTWFNIAGSQQHPCDCAQLPRLSSPACKIRSSSSTSLATIRLSPDFSDKTWKRSRIFSISSLILRIFFSTCRRLLEVMRFLVLQALQLL